MSQIRYRISSYSFCTCMYCYQRPQYIRLNTKKNIFRGNYMRKYGKYILHCRPSNFTTLTKQNISRCLSLKFLSAEMDKYVLHIAANAHACLWPKLDHWIIGLPPRRSTSFFWKRIFIPSSALVTTTHNRVKKIMKSKFHFSILHRHHLVARDGFWINWIIGLPPRRSTSFFWKRIFIPSSTLVTTTHNSVKKFMKSKFHFSILHRHHLVPRDVFWINWFIGLPPWRSTSFFFKADFRPVVYFYTTTFTMGPNALWIFIPNSLMRYFLTLYISA